MMFYKETNFKETPIGKIPKDWEIEKLGILCKFKRGFSYRSSQVTSNTTQIRFLTINDVEKEGGLKREAEKLYIKEGVEVDPEFFVNEGDVFIANTDMAKGFIIGAPLLMKNMNGKYVYSMDLTKLIFNKAKVNSIFLFYYLTHPSMRIRMKASAQGTNVLHLNHIIVSNFFIPLPSLPEQQRIAEILSTFDEAIQKTNEIIAKTECLKKGLMQELLTKGIGHKEFKDTEIGRIPKEWEVVKLKDVVSEAKPGFACGKRDENGILQLRMDNIEPEGWINVEAGVKVPIPEDVEDYILKPGDILFNNTNSVDLIGKTAIFRGEFSRCVYSNHLTRIRVDRSKVVPEWVLYLLIRKWELGVFKVICHRHVHQAGINNEDLLRLKIPLPSLQEQQKITSIILTVDSKIKLERMEKAKLEKIKQGLMDLLLTGKIRVKVNSNG